MTLPPDNSGSNNPGDGADNNNDPLSEMLRRMFGEQGPNPDDIRRAMEEMQGSMPGGMPAGMTPDMFNPAMMQQAFSQFQAMMSQQSSSSEPVNWDLARQTARQITAGKDPSVGTFAAREVDDAIRLAELWLNEVTELEPTGLAGTAWSRAEWVENTLDNWKTMTEPVVNSLARAFTRALAEQLPEALPEEARSMMGNLEQVMQNLGGSMMSAQLGHAFGELSQEVLSGTDTGFPVSGHRLVLMPVNIEEFSDGLHVDPDQIRIYLALREAARMRLFMASPWLERDLTGAIQQYAAELTIDVTSVEEAVQSVDPMDPESMQQVFSGQAFIPEPTGSQKLALERLETTLAIIEGWVDVVVAEAAKPLNDAPALREMINRRRAAGGPAEHAFGALVGLDIRPRRLREAAEFWQQLTDEKGKEYRDEIWHNQLWMPESEDLDDPAGYEARRRQQEEQSASIDEELQKLLAGEYDNPSESDEDNGPDTDRN